MPEPVDDPRLTVDAGPTRVQQVAAVAERWADCVRDLVGGDPLLHYRDLPEGSLDLTHTHPSGLAMLLAGRPCRLSALLREPGALSEARRRARSVRARMAVLASERGLESGWLAVGLATWDVPDDEPAPAAPVLLRSCRLRPRGSTGEDVDLDLGGRIVLNPVLVAAMADLGAHLDAEVIAGLALREDGFDPRPVLERVAQTCRDVPGFAIESRYVVSTFVTAWPSLLHELQQPERLASHDVVAALAGDVEAREAVAAGPDDASLEAASADVSAHLVLDADAEQSQALAAVLAGSHLLLDAPSATGATQTIANLVALMAGAGRRVLLLSEKRVALDDVLRRLAGVGLRDLVLDLPDGGADRRRALREIAQTLDRAGSVPQPEPSPAAARREELRALLDGHVAALHEPRNPWGSSAFEAQQALAALTARRPAPRSRVRVRSEDLTALDRAELERLRDALRAAADAGVFHAGPEDDPWFGSALSTDVEAEEALARATRLGQDTLPQARELLSPVLAEAGMPAARSATDWDRALRLLADVRATLEVFSAKVYDTSLADVVAATGTGAWRTEHGVRMGSVQRRRLRRHARSLLRPGRPPADLHERLLSAAEQRRRWQELAGRGSVPRLPSGLATAERAYRKVRADLEWLAQRLQSTPAGGGLLTDDLDALIGRLQLLAGRTTSLPLVPKTVALRARLAAVGLEPLLDDLAQRDVPAEDVGAELDLVWWTSLLQHVAQTDPRYGRHDGDALRQAARDFAEADRAHMQVAAQQVRRAAAGRLVRALDRHGDQAELLRTESGRDRRWRSLPDLVRAAPDVLAAAHPCWAMSPLVVPQALPDEAAFDVVVVDEASQLQSGEVVAALSRGRQVVVVGDPQQLGPSGSLTREPGSEPRTSVLEELADLLPEVRLRNAHGVLDHRVLAFADEHAYGGSLRALPSPAVSPALSLHQVDGTGVLLPDQDSVETTDAEVQRVVELVVHHARTRPQESLGVVALTTAHAARVEAALRLQLSHHSEVATFVAADRPEPFFITVADRAQGDVRDVIVLTVGFGRTPHGRVLHRFGALSAERGERLLVTATTRARRRLQVVAAFGAVDLDPERLTSGGARALRDLLVHASTGGGVGLHGSSGTSVDLLLGDVAARLDDLEVAQPYGPPSAEIDLVVGEGSGGWLVAVESDGPGYAQLSPRERDRLRPEALVRRGWRHERLWSTDVFRDPAREVARVRAAVRDAQVSRRSAGRRAPSVGAAGDAAGQPTVRWDSHGGASPWAAVAPQRRGDRPRVPTGRAVEDYREDELDAVVAWICSDTLLRTQEQLAALVRQQLGLVRRSARVDRAVGDAIARVVARGEAQTVEPSPGSGGQTTSPGRPRASNGVQAHDPHERWLLDQRPPHWD